MTAVQPLTVAHRGGTRHGDVILCTPTEWRELEVLRRQMAAVRQLVSTAVAGFDLYVYLDELTEALR